MTNIKIIKPVYLNNTIDEMMRSIYQNADDFFTNFDSLFKPTLKFPEYPHSVSVTEDGATILEIAAGGFDKNEIDVDVEDNVITITGERNTDCNKEETHYLHNSLVKRNFKLSYKLSDKTDIDNIVVSLDKGILKIEIPIKPECKPQKKKINIQ